MTQDYALEQRKLEAWEKAHEIIGEYPSRARRDAFGYIIHWSEYGNRNSPFGWEIDHIRPTLLGGTDAGGNLRALNWKANATLGGLLGRVAR